tara:strand:+ start:448 stop:609 length:162 start_codon:yes stop_codon:yes gene_type:complete
MIKLTAELKKQIEESGVPLITITLEQLSKAHPTACIGSKDTVESRDIYKNTLK